MLNPGHEVQFLTVVSVISDIFHREFENNAAAWKLCELNPEIKVLVDCIEDDLGDLYQAIGNAKPWRDE